MINLPSHIDFKFKGFWNVKKEPYIPPTEEELIAKDLQVAEERKKIRRDLARSILQEDPEFLQELIIDLRKKKMERFKK